MLNHKKFYFDLLVDVRVSEWQRIFKNAQDAIDLDGCFALKHEDSIREGFEKYHQNQNMAEYFYRDDDLKSRITSIKWDFEEVDGCLYGVVDVAMHGDLDEREIDLIKDYIIGQNADGLGEGFEQQDIETSEGTLSVHFWAFGYDNKIYTEDEFNELQDQGMGGI